MLDLALRPYKRNCHRHFRDNARVDRCIVFPSGVRDLVAHISFIPQPHPMFIASV